MTKRYYLKHGNDDAALLEIDPLDGAIHRVLALQTITG